MLIVFCQTITPPIRFPRFWRYINLRVCMYVCMYVEAMLKSMGEAKFAHTLDASIKPLKQFGSIW